MKKFLNVSLLQGVLTVFCSVSQAAPNNVPVQENKAAVQKSGNSLAAKKSELQNLLRDIAKEKTPFAGRIERVSAMRKDPQYAAPELQRLLLDQILAFASIPSWTGIKNYDYSLLDTVMKPTAIEILSNPDIPPAGKRKALSSLAVYYCGVKQFDKAEAVVNKFLAQPISAEEKTITLYVLRDVFKFQDRCDDAMNTAKKIEVLDKEKGVFAQAELAYEFGKDKEAEEILDRSGDAYYKLHFHGSRQNPRLGMSQTGNVTPNIHSLFVRETGVPAAVAYVKNVNHPLKNRVTIAAEYLFWNYGNAEMSAVRRSLADSPEMKAEIFKQMKCVFDYHDYRLVSEMCDMCAGHPNMNKAEYRRMQVIAFSVCGRTEEAVKLCRTFAADETMKPAEQFLFQMYAAILNEENLDNVISACKLSDKDKAEVVSFAGKQSLIWGKNDAAEKLSSVYEAFFGEKISRTLPVKFFDTPVNSITDWRKVHHLLPKQYCDVRFRISQDFLAQDVGSGRGDIQFDTDAKQGAYVEITSLCDVSGIHVYLRSEDPEARKVQEGFMPCCSEEMYIAAGYNQPYVCIGADQREGITYLFNTAYNNRNHRRLNRKDAENFKIETEFTDTDYVQHIFFSWNSFFNKLPDNGSEYRYECICFVPSGSYSWGGSHAVHTPSTWGSLKFELTDHQLNMIRRSLLMKCFRKYKTVPREVQNTSLFTIWSDQEIGDPDFYNKVLAPLEKELDAYAAMVKPDMTDAEVEKVYTDAVPRMKGLCDEVDSLRRKYLLDRLIEKGY